MKKHVSRIDLLIALGFLLAAGAFLGDTLVGGKVLLPVDNLFRMQPWRALADQAGVAVPHNELISDMILQNVSWKRFAASSIRAGSVPLWNPYTFAGVPFLAAGQYGVLYPLGVLFYLMPPERAYGWFTALHLFIGAIGAYLFLRVIGGGRIGGVVAGLAFAFSGFVVVSFLWPQVVSTLVWLPLLLAFVELIVRSQEAAYARPPRHSEVRGAGLLVALGGLAVGIQFLAGHLEMSFYILFTLLFYGAARLVVSLWSTRCLGLSVRSGLLLAGMLASGATIAGAQLLPFYELIGHNYRAAGWSTYQEVVGYALPKQQALALLMPDLYGNPTHHAYFDVLQRQERSVAENARGEPTSPPQTIFWGVKNYVEAAGYVGVLPLVLALLAILLVRTRYVAIFAAYAVFALLLALGTPLYAIFYFGVPGFEQLHTPFRWLFPYSLSVAVLAGIGASKLGERGAGALTPPSAPLSRFAGEGPGVRALPPAPPSRRGKGVGGLGRPSLVALVVGLGALMAGLAVVAGLGVSLAFPERFVAAADAFLQRTPAAARAFASGRMLYSYELRNLLVFGLCLAGSGAVVCLAARGRRRIWPVLAALVLLADLFVFGYGFNSRTDPKLLDLRPGSVDFLASQPGLFRIVSFGDEDVLKPDTGMLYGLQDVRGYDTVIPRQYVEYWSLMEPPQGLPYSMIHKLVRRESLASKYLDLLNVRYVLTTQELCEEAAPVVPPHAGGEATSLPTCGEGQQGGLRLAYDGEIKVYERTTALPRAFFVTQAQFVSDGASALAALRRPDFDPRREVILEGQGEPFASAAFGQVEVESYQPNQVVLRAFSNAPGFLVLADSYFPGWEATIDGQPAPIYRADGNFRAVELAGGQHQVVLKYSPVSFKLGLFTSLLGLTVVALLLGIYVWRRLLASPDEPGTVRRVGRNSLAPMATSLMNKAVDVAFAMLMLRLLGPENVGKYTFAVVVVGYLDILTNFGLNALLIREVARTPEARHRYLTGSILLRLSLWGAAAPLALAGLYLGRGALGLTPDTLLVVAVLCLALVPGNVSAAISSLFNAFERMEHPAMLAVVTNLLRIGLGAAVLLAGWGIVGLAGVSLLVNVVTVALFAILAVRALGRPRFELRPGLLREMLATSYPLMLNHFLATLFFKVDSLFLWLYQGSTVVGYYGTAYKFVDGLQIIPSSFVFAIFPLMSRRAGEGAESLRRAYVVALRVLVGLALPIAVATAFLAGPLVLILGGPEYLPHSAIALAVLIWFLPFGFANGVTQYVLIAIDQQRFITLSFVIAAGFNILANLYAIPRFGYVGAAATTILSELALMAPFHYCIRRHLGPVPLASLLARPAVAAAGMAALLWLARDFSILAALPAATLLYLVLLVAVRAVTPEELALGWQVVRERIARRRAAAAERSLA